MNKASVAVMKLGVQYIWDGKVIKRWLVVGMVYGAQYIVCKKLKLLIVSEDVLRASS